MQGGSSRQQNNQQCKANKPRVLQQTCGQRQLLGFRTQGLRNRWTSSLLARKYRFLPRPCSAVSSPAPLPLPHTLHQDRTCSVLHRWPSLIICARDLPFTASCAADRQQTASTQATHGHQYTKGEATTDEIKHFVYQVQASVCRTAQATVCLDKIDLCVQMPFHLLLDSHTIASIDTICQYSSSSSLHSFSWFNPRYRRTNQLGAQQQPTSPS